MRKDVAIAPPSQSPAVPAPPKGEPSLIPTYTHIEAGLPLPSGEVAMPQGIDGEGSIPASEHPIPLTPFPGEGGHDAEGAAHLRSICRKYETVVIIRGTSRGRPLHPFFRLNYQLSIVNYQLSISHSGFPCIAGAWFQAPQGCRCGSPARAAWTHRACRKDTTPHAYAFR